MLAGECGVGRSRCSTPTAIRSRIAAEVDMDADRRGLDAARAAPAGRAAIGSACAPPPRRLPMPACSTAASIASRVGVLPRRGHGRSAAQRGFLPHLDDVRPRSAPGRPTRGIIFRARRWTSIAEQFGFEGPRACVVAACSSSTIAIGRGVDAIRAGRADAALAGGTDALSRLTFSGFNALRLMDPAPCRPFDRSRAGMNIGEGAGILVLEDLDARAAPRRDDLRRARRPQPGVRGVSSDRARARRAAGGGRRDARAARRGRQRRRGGSHQRARHGHAAERRAEARGFRARVRRPHRQHSRHVAEVDDRPLPRRGRGASKRRRWR